MSTILLVKSKKSAAVTTVPLVMADLNRQVPLAGQCTGTPGA